MFFIFPSNCNIWSHFLYFYLNVLHVLIAWYAFSLCSVIILGNWSFCSDNVTMQVHLLILILTQSNEGHVFFIAQILTCTNYEKSHFCYNFACVNFCEIRLCHLFLPFAIFSLDIPRTTFCIENRSVKRANSHFNISSLWTLIQKIF